jgi:hypothetical protein
MLIIKYMARFERRKVPNPTQSQPLARAYARNTVQSLNTSSITQTNTSQQQLMTVLKKHDNLLSKLLKRFNGFEKSINDMIDNKMQETMSDSNIVKELEALKIANAGLESKLESVNDDLSKVEKNAIVVLADDVIEATDGTVPRELKHDVELFNSNYEVIRTFLENQQEHIEKNAGNVNNIIETVDDIQNNMASAADLTRNQMEIKHEFKAIVESMEEKYQTFHENQMQQLTDWMNSVQYNMRTAEIVEDYEKEKDNLFYPNNELDDAGILSIDTLEEVVTGEMVADSTECITELEIEEKEEEEQFTALEKLEKDVEIQVVKKSKKKPKNIELEISEKN